MMRLLLVEYDLRHGLHSIRKPAFELAVHSGLLCAVRFGDTVSAAILKATEALPSRL